MMLERPTSRNNALLCPRCRRLISADEPRCPHCGLSKPAVWWKRTILTRIFDGGESLVLTIIAANVVMYLLSLLTSSSGPRLSANPMNLLSPDSQGLLLLGATGTIPIDRLHRWWTLVSASYLHGGILHILFNMLALRQIAALVIQTFGTHRMLVIYSLSGVAGFLVSYLAGVRFTIGASAAVCGLIGAALYYGKNRGGIYGQAIYRQVGGWALGIVLFGLVVPGINNWAHGGGMAAGALLGMLMGYQERKPENPRHRMLSVLCLLGTAAILLVSIVSGLTQRFPF